MSKIKDIIEKMKANGNEYHEVHLLIAKRVWLIIASLYYLFFLFTVGGYYFGPISIELLSMLTFNLFSILVIATAWFFYSLCEYAINVYLPTRRWLLILIIVLELVLLAGSLLVHTGLIT